MTRPSSSEICGLTARGSGGGSVLCLRATESRFAFERDPSRQHFEEDDADGVDVRALAGHFSLDLFGRHVFGRPDHRPGARYPLGLEGAGDAEIHDLDAPLPVDHDVLRLEVAVDDAEAVGFGQSLADLIGDINGLPRAEPPHHPDHALQVLAADVLHGDVMRALVFAEVVHPADVLVRDLPGRPELVAEPLDRLAVGGDLGVEELQGDLFVDLFVEDLVDPAHPAFAQFLEHIIAAGEHSCF
jgi:hypothetical protein